MQFRNFVTKALGSETRVRVLLYLLGEPSPASEREIAGRLGVSNAAINKIMKDFSDINLVTRMRVGAAHVWQLNKHGYAYKVLQGLGELAKRPPLDDLKDRLEILKKYPAVRKVIVFGSVAESRELPQSDIDVFVLIDREDSRRAVSDALSKLADDCLRDYGNVLSPTVFTEKEVGLKKNTSLLERVERGIKVIG